VTRIFVIVAGWGVFAFLTLPLLAILPLSFTSGDLLILPTPGWSLRWYADFFQSSRWLEATRNSFLVGFATALIATPLGAMAAVGLDRLGGRTRHMLTALLSLPLLAPVVIAALAIYLAFAAVGLTSSFAGLVLAHSVLAAPFALLSVAATLEGLDPSLMRAAASLGAPPWTAWRRVLIPVLWPGVASGGLLAFATSFDELVVALFVAGPNQMTLPRQMYGGLREFLSPTLCAAAALSSLLSVGLLGIATLLRRRAVPTTAEELA
jgi:putative spermidine/putrescine transport system permease protein